MPDLETRQIVKVPIDQIRVDGGTQLRVETDPAVVADYAARMEDGERFPALSVIRDGDNNLWLWDGFHRLAAAKVLVRQKVDVAIKPGTLDDARLLACKANAKHGLQRSQQTKRNQVRAALLNPLTAGWSNGRIASWCEVSAPFVAGIRQAMELTPSEVVGANGKTYKVAEKISAANVYACPSLAQVEEWGRTVQDKATQHAVHAMADLLAQIEQAEGWERWAWHGGLSQAVHKGRGAIVALAMRFAEIADEGSQPESWPELLERATAAPDAKSTWELATAPGLSLAERERAILAALQVNSVGRDGAWRRDECATEALRVRWDVARAQKANATQRQKANVAEEVATMSAEKLREFSRRWFEPSTRAAVIQRAREVAPDLLWRCPDPLCAATNVSRVSCDTCGFGPEMALKKIAAEAQRTDARRRLQGDPLTMVLEMLQHHVDPGDEDLLWHRVAVWREAGCPGLAPTQGQKDQDEENAA